LRGTPLRSGPLRRCGLAAPGRRRYPRAGQVPDDRDLLPVDHDLRRALEPVTGQPSGQPAPYLFRRAGSIALPLGAHLILITRRVAPRNAFSTTRGHQPLSARPGPARRLNPRSRPRAVAASPPVPVYVDWLLIEGHGEIPSWSSRGTNRRNNCPTVDA